MKIFLTVLLFASVICAVFLCKYAYQRRNMPGAKYFLLLLLMAIIYNGGYIGELNADNYQTAKFWFDLEHIAIPAQQYFWLLLSLEFTNLNKRTFRIISTIALYHPLLYYAVYFIPDLNRFYIENYHFVDRGSFYVITSENGIFFFVLVVSGTLIGIISNTAYIIGYLRASNFQRKIYLIMIVATIFPWMTVYVNAMDIGGGVDFFPFATILSGLLYMVGIFQFKVFHTIPIATEIVFRQSKEVILLLDMEQKIVDANACAVHLFPELENCRKKCHLMDFIERYPQLEELLSEKDTFQFELKLDNKVTYFEAIVKKISTDSNLDIGKIVQIFDITGTYLEKKQMEELVTSAIDQAETSEISLLQAQISPHFINNSLSVIASMITRAPEEAKVMITDLGDYLANCYYFDTKTYMVDLEKEIETVNTYVNIEKARFRERLCFHIVREELPDIRIPRLVLQPLVENAIRHGILKKIEGGSVWLKMKREAQFIRFEIQDDGVGMSGEFLDRLMSAERPGKGIGIWNIHTRLLKYYGEGLEIVSAPGRGTAVYFRIPFPGGYENREEEMG